MQLIIAKPYYVLNFMDLVRDAANQLMNRVNTFFIIICPLLSSFLGEAIL
mgnify:CR=1 FL=1